MARAIPTIAPAKGGLAIGHRVYAIMPDGLPAVPGVIVEATAAAVTMDVGAVLSILGLPRRSRWTWRRSASAYQQTGTRTRLGVGIVIDGRLKMPVRK